MNQLRALSDTVMAHGCHVDSVALRAVTTGFAGMIASLVIQPLEVLRVRLQLYRKPCTTLSMARKVVAREGYRVLYVGTSSALFRQATTTTTRVGVFNYQMDEYIRKWKRKPDLYERLKFSVTSGICGALMGTPAEVVWIRRMADGGKPKPGFRFVCSPRYTGTFHGLRTIYRKEGIAGLWRGGTLTVTRAVMVSVASLIGYAYVYKMLKHNKWAQAHKEHFHAVTLIISVFFTSMLTFPLDVLKTLYQEKKDHRTMPEILKDVYKIRYSILFRAFPTYYTKMTLHALITFLMVTEIRRFYHNLYKDEEVDSKGKKNK